MAVFNAPPLKRSKHTEYRGTAAFSMNNLSIVIIDVRLSPSLLSGACGIPRPRMPRKSAPTISSCRSRTKNKPSLMYATTLVDGRLTKSLAMSHCMSPLPYAKSCSNPDCTSVGVTCWSARKQSWNNSQPLPKGVSKLQKHDTTTMALLPVSATRRRDCGCWPGYAVPICTSTVKDAPSSNNGAQVLLGCEGVAAGPPLLGTADATCSSCTERSSSLSHSVPSVQAA
mmetsp:Transcript_6164/g.10726  ORF Transcript_6164/g.10726 Transcript_6164/m.10726 type:complete len:227 (+) Transcript_6164:834-1514(+)